jgi:hypothetical protein
MVTKYHARVDKILVISKAHDDEVADYLLVDQQAI